MRNYFTRLGVSPDTSEEELLSALEKPDIKLSGKGLEDAKAVLEDKVMLRMYQKAFLQYEAMRTAIDCIESSPGLDTNHWQARLSNFDSEPEEPIKRWESTDHT
ncbi:MAG: hypothetical protein KTR32_24860 [Granulosicoccus sp.]|nr:hypothetical protein [Granulosicoccus sp.]